MRTFPHGRVSILGCSFHFWQHHSGGQYRRPSFRVWQRHSHRQDPAAEFPFLAAVSKFGSGTPTGRPGPLAVPCSFQVWPGQRFHFWLQFWLSLAATLPQAGSGGRVSIFGWSFHFWQHHSHRRPVPAAEFPAVSKFGAGTPTEGPGCLSENVSKCGASDSLQQRAVSLCPPHGWRHGRPEALTRAPGPRTASCVPLAV